MTIADTRCTCGSITGGDSSCPLHGVTFVPTPPATFIPMPVPDYTQQLERLIQAVEGLQIVMDKMTQQRKCKHRWSVTAHNTAVVPGTPCENCGVPYEKAPWR